MKNNLKPRFQKWPSRVSSKHRKPLLFIFPFTHRKYTQATFYFCKCEIKTIAFHSTNFWAAKVIHWTQLLLMLIHLHAWGEETKYEMCVTIMLHRNLHQCSYRKPIDLIEFFKLFFKSSKWKWNNINYYNICFSSFL